MTSEELLKKSHSDQISYWFGRLCMSLPRPDGVQNLLFELIIFYQKEAYDRGVAAGKAERKRK